MPRPALLVPAALLLAIFLAGLGLTQAWGHFLLNTNIRLIHVEHLDDGLQVYLRLPMPYLVADKLGTPQADGTVEPAPFTVNERIEGELMHRIDLEALRQDPGGLGRMVAEGHRFAVDGAPLTAVVEKVRVTPALKQSPFATLEEAKRSFEGPLYPEDEEAAFVGDLVVDVQLRYRSGDDADSYEVSSTLNPGLEGQEETANLLLDYYPGSDPQVFRVRGLLAEPVEVSRSYLTAALSFVVDGIRHILEGLDHVLFVLCLTIGAFTLGQLLWRVTGFSIGHTITLIAGFFGYVPSGAWFIPAVETGIALSIIYAAAIALANKPVGATVVVTVLIGLLHGLGFSFVLHEILQINAPNLWQSLLAFNVGIELGQLAIVVLVYPLLWLIARANPKWATMSRWAIALPCILIAAVWTGERVLLLLQTL